jgi:hypothetical protein
VSPRQDPQVIWSQCLEPITHLAAAEEYAASLGDKLAEGVDESSSPPGEGACVRPECAQQLGPAMRLLRAEPLHVRCQTHTGGRTYQTVERQRTQRASGSPERPGGLRQPRRRLRRRPAHRRPSVAGPRVRRAETALAEDVREFPDAPRGGGRQQWKRPQGDTAHSRSDGHRRRVSASQDHGVEVMGCGGRFQVGKRSRRSTATSRCSRVKT